jgi:5-methyltetrahydropteroyltriglutamate--homocysteine methyltransferase
LLATTFIVAASLDEVRGTAEELRAKHWKLQAQAGVDLIPSNDFSYYDQMLDTAILLNVIPQRYKRLAIANASVQPQTVASITSTP